MPYLGLAVGATDFPISQSRPVASIKRDVRPCRSTRIHIHLIEHFNEAPREIIRDRDADRTTGVYRPPRIDDKLNDKLNDKRNF